MTEPKLSIIIPCYNSADTLPEAIDSCFTQGFTEDEFEIVLVNDHSTDATLDIITSYSARHKNIKVYSHTQNKGGGATRNTAAEHAEAEVLFCLDSDDILPPNTLSNMLSFMHEKKCDGVGINRSIKFRGVDTKDIDLVHTFGYAGEKIPFISLLQKDEVYCPLYSTFMISKKVLNAIGGYPVQHGFDTQGIAWRFLAGGYTAFTCPGAEYLHRTHFNQSYYIREAEAGKVNYNWQDIFAEHLHLFEEDTQNFILGFNCKDFTKNIFEELKKRDRIFKSNVLELLGTTSKKISLPPRTFIHRNSITGIILRLRERLKGNKVIYSIVIFLYALLKRIQRLLTEGATRRAYYNQIENIKLQKKIVVDLSFGGIGDCLAWSSLPRLLKETYGIDFYLSRKSLEVLRHKDTLTLCFEANPYYKGVSDDTTVFKINFFESEKSFFTFITDKKGKTVTEILEAQFKVKGFCVPELHYQPKLLPEYQSIILVDENTISGKRFGWEFKENAFQKEALQHKEEGDTIEFVDTKKQDLFTYVDMIYSCKCFVGTFSGGASIAACFKKPFYVIWPTNAKNGSNYQYCYTKSTGKYVD